MNPAVNTEKQRHKAVGGIVSSCILIGLALSIGLAGLFFFLDAWGQVLKARQREQWFDPWGESAESQYAYQCLDITGLSQEFAVDFKETRCYCFAFGPSGGPVIVKIQGDLEEQFQPYRDALYEDGAEMPEPFRIRGVTAPVEDDIREYAIESLNIMYDSQVVSEDNFEKVLGVSILDTTRKPMGAADFGIGLGMGLFGLVFGGMGIVFLVMNIKRRRKLAVLEERQRERMRQAGMWENAGYAAVSDTGFGQSGDGGWGEESYGSTANEFGYTGSAQEGYTSSSGVRLVPVKKSNVFLGILGAIGGSLLGVGLWLLISFVGFIAGFAGFVMLKCALKGYEMLSGKLDKKGAMISLAITAFMIFFANGLEYVIALCQAFLELDASLDTIRYVLVNFAVLMTETESWGGFYMNLVLGYGLSIWASYKVIWGIFSYKEERDGKSW